MYASRMDANNEWMQVGEAGGDDGQILRDLDAEGSAPVVVGEVGRFGVAVEEVKLRGDGYRNADNYVSWVLLGVGGGRESRLWRKRNLCMYLNRAIKAQETDTLLPASRRRFQTKRGRVTRRTSNTIFVIPI